LEEVKTKDIGWIIGSIGIIIGLVGIVASIVLGSRMLHYQGLNIKHETQLSQRKDDAQLRINKYKDEIEQYKARITKYSDETAMCKEQIRQYETDIRRLKNRLKQDEGFIKDIP